MHPHKKTAVLRRLVVYGVTLTVLAAFGWTAPRAAEGGGEPDPCSPRTSLFYGYSCPYLSVTLVTVPGGDTSLTNDMPVMSFTLGKGMPPVPIDVTFGGYIDRTTGTWQPFVKSYENPDVNGLYTCTDPAVKAKVKYDDGNVVLLGADGSMWSGATNDWTTAGGTLIAHQTFSGGTLVGEEKADGVLYTARSVDGSGRPLLITERRGLSTPQTDIKKTHFRYTPTSGVLVRKRITVEESNSDGTQRFLTTIYGYYGSGDYAGNLKFVVRPEGVKRYLAGGHYDDGIVPGTPGGPCPLDDDESVQDADLTPYAEVVYEDAGNDKAYDSNDRITRMVAHGAGCCGGGGEEGVYLYQHGPESPSGTGWNTWRTWRRTTHPSGLRTVEFLNEYRRIVFKVEWSDDIAHPWVTHYKYYTTSGAKEGLVQEVRHPSACTTGNGYVFTSGDGWITDVTPDDDGTSGLVETFDYHDPSGKLAEVKVRNGPAGAVQVLRRTAYDDNATYNNVTTYNDITIYRPWKETIYPNGWDGTGNEPEDAEATTFTYDYYTDSHAVKNETVAYPAVTAGKNGSAAATAVTHHYTRDLSADLYYNSWTKHEDGVLDYVELGGNLSTCGSGFYYGQVVKRIVDVDDTQTTDFADMPDGWETPTGAGRHLKTTSLYYDNTDDGSYTRLKSVTDPGGKHSAYAYLSTKKTDSGKETTTSLVTLITPHMDDDDDYDYAPIQITVADLAGRTIIAATGDPSDDEDGDLRDDLTSDYKNGTTDVSDLETGFVGTLVSRTDSGYDTYGFQLVTVDRYRNIPASGTGTEGTDFYRTEYGYDSATGRRCSAESPDGTITYTVYAPLGREVETWVGTDATGASQTAPEGNGSNNMKKVSATFYDEWDANQNPVPGSGISGVGDGNVTQTKAFYDAANSYNTVYRYDWRNRLERTLGPDKVLVYRDLDNLDRTEAVTTYADIGDIAVDLDDEATTPKLRAKTETEYDAKGQVYQTIVYEVDPTNGTPGDTLTTNYWYDPRGRLIKTVNPNGLFSKTVYDGAGRAVATYLSYDAGEDTYTETYDPDTRVVTLADDTVIEQVKNLYNDGGNVWLTRHFRRYDTAIETQTGELNAPSVGDPKARVTYAAAWFDELGRTTKTVDYGTNGSNVADNVIDDAADDFNPDPENKPGVQAYDAQGEGDIPEPDTYDMYIVTKYGYNSAGRLEYVYDNKNKKTYREYDDLGRVTKVVENYANGVDEDDVDTDRTTEYAYGTSGHLSEITAWKPEGDNNGVEDQVTKYVYGSALGVTTPAICRNDLLRAVIYPDSDDPVDLSGNGPDTAYDRVEYTYDRLGRRATMKDQRGGVVHAYDYIGNGAAAAGRLQKNRLTSWAGVDTFVSSIKYAYDDLGRLLSATSYHLPNCLGPVYNQVVFAYDGWGNVIKSQQEHAGAVDANTPDVEYAYADGGEADDTAEYVRLKYVEYPNGRRVHYTYPASDIGSVLSRLDEIVPDNAGSPDMTAGHEYAQYTYLGADTVVQVDHPAVDDGLTLSYKGASAGVYPGFDRFGRVRWQSWKKTDGTILDRYFYGYDRAGNRTWRAERIDPDEDPTGRDEAYGYDGLHRLVKAQRGIVTETEDGLLAPVGGDVNHDDVVDANDYDEVDKGFLFDGDEWEEGDFNDDGAVNANDYDIIDRSFLVYPSRSVSRTWQWSLDHLGNWTGYKEHAGDDDAWDLEQVRQHNEVNEIDTNNVHSDGPDDNAITQGGGQTAWISPKCDAAGNTTLAPRPGDEATDAEGLLMVYDAWNRLVEVWKDNGGATPDKQLVKTGDDKDTLLVKYRYDALNRRIAKLIPNGETNRDRTDYYYNESWQCLEERVETVANETTAAAAVKFQYVWDIRYIDAPVLRDEDKNTDGDCTDEATGDQDSNTGDEHLYYTQDANFNVTALVDGYDGAVVQRYLYDPYGQPSVRHGVRDSDGDDTSESEWAERTTNLFANEILFCGYRYDPETGLYHVRHRQYHPTLGRWLQRDPIGYEDGMGLYQYCHSGPLSGLDPAGLDSPGEAIAHLVGGIGTDGIIIMGSLASWFGVFDAIDYGTTAGMMDRWTGGTGEPWVLSAYDRDRLRSKKWHRDAEILLVSGAANWLYDNAQKLGCWETWQDTAFFKMPADWTGRGFLSVFDPVASWSGTYEIRVQYQGSVTKTCPYYPNVDPECCYYSAELQGAYMVDDVYRWYKPEKRGWDQFKNKMVPLGMMEESGEAKEFSWLTFWQDAWQKSGRWDKLEAILKLAPHFGQ